MIKVIQSTKFMLWGVMFYVAEILDNIEDEITYHADEIVKAGCYERGTTEWE